MTTILDKPSLSELHQPFARAVQSVLQRAAGSQRGHTRPAERAPLSRLRRHDQRVGRLLGRDAEKLRGRRRDGVSALRHDFGGGRYGRLGRGVRADRR